MASLASAAPTEPGCNPLPSVARAHATGGGRVHFVHSPTVVAGCVSAGASMVSLDVVANPCGTC